MILTKLKYNETGFEEEEEFNIIYTPVVVTENFIAEQVYNPEQPFPTYYYVRYFNKGEPSSSLHIFTRIKDEARGIAYLPLDNSTLRKNLILLPREPKKCSFEEVYQEGCNLALEMYRTPEDKIDEVKFLVAVCQSSWFYDRFNIQIPGMGAFAPIIALRGPSGSGKDRLLNALRLNAYKPFYDVSTRRIPSLYRPLDQWKGTLCLSEMDFKGGDETSELIHYLNCRSYGVPISRQSPDNPKYNETFYNFGLTIVTQRRPWEDDATEDRTLPFYCEKTPEPVPTTELDEWVERGVELQNKLLYLRLTYYDKVVIQKGERIEGVGDHRLTASVLPLLALSKHNPSLDKNLLAILRRLERRRRQAKAESKEGVIINYIYERWREGLRGEHNGILYIGKDKMKVANEERVVPLQVSDIAEELKLTTNNVRRILNSLRLHHELEKLPRVIKIDRAYRPIWVNPQTLESLFLDFVVDYVSEEKVTEVTEVTLLASGSPAEYRTVEKSVTSVTSVTDSTSANLKRLFRCRTCGAGPWKYYETAREHKSLFSQHEVVEVDAREAFEGK